MDNEQIFQRLFKRLLIIISIGGVIVFFIFFLVFFPSDLTNPNYKVLMFFSGLFVNLVSSLLTYLALSLVFFNKTNKSTNDNQQDKVTVSSSASDAIINSFTILINNSQLQDNDKSSIRSELTVLKRKHLISLADFQKLISQVDER